MASRIGVPNVNLKDPRNDYSRDRQVSWGLDQPLSPRARNISGGIVNLVDVEEGTSNSKNQRVKHNIVDLDEDSSFSDDPDYYDDDPEDIISEIGVKNIAALKKNDVHKIPGSPWAKPRARHSKRPTEPLQNAKYASILGFALALGWVVYLFVVATWEYSSIGRIIVEIILAILAFMGLFWNTYFTASSICKCFIPARAFKENGKYFSVVPEKKHPDDKWLPVTIQIPVYKEGMDDVLGPTLESCMRAREHYHSRTGASCNIIVCDDGMMNFLRDNFSAAEMLWQNVRETRGEVPIKPLLQRIPHTARRHLAGLRSKNIVEVFNRMVYYYHNDIGFVARHTLDRRGKFKKASNLNTHLKLVFGAQQLSQETGKPLKECLLKVAHNEDGSREVMFGGNIVIGALMVINDADARMSPSVIKTTVPEFLNDKKLGFTQHATKTMDDQRGETYYLRLIETYTDALYQGHFLLSSIMGCHPPLVGHSIFLRTEAVKQCGRMRMLRKGQRWLKNIGLPFLGVDQVGFVSLQSESCTEYWSEEHVSEDFELMIHLYNIGYTGRYCAFPGTEFEEGVTRTFDEEAGRHRKFSLGAHELMFNPFQDMIGHGIYTDLFKNFLTCDIPSYYKIFLTAYLQSYMSGGVYVIIFVIAAITRLLDIHQIESMWAFSPAAIIIINVVIYYVIGYTTFLIALCRMHYHNKNLLFPEYREHGKFYLVFRQLRHTMLFQLLFYTVMGNYFFLGGLDHLMSRSRICGATNKDALTVSMSTAFKDVINFNSGAWAISIALGVLAIAVLWEEYDFTTTDLEFPTTEELLFSGPPVAMAIFGILCPILLNPYATGCYKREKKDERPMYPREPTEHITIDEGTVATKLYNHQSERKKSFSNKGSTSRKQKKTKQVRNHNAPCHV